MTRLGLLSGIRAISNGSGSRSIETLVKSLGYILALEAVGELKPCGARCHQFTGNVQCAIPIFGRLIEAFFPVNGIAAGARRAVKLTISSASTALYGNGFLGW